MAVHLTARTEYNICLEANDGNNFYRFRNSHTTPCCPSYHGHRLLWHH